MSLDHNKDNDNRRRRRGIAAGNVGRVAFGVNLELIAPRTLVDDTAAPDEGEPAAEEDEAATPPPPADNGG